MNKKKIIVLTITISVVALLLISILFISQSEPTKKTIQDTWGRIRYNTTSDDWMDDPLDDAGDGAEVT